MSLTSEDELPVCFQSTSIKTTTFRSQVETETRINELATTAVNQYIIVCEMASNRSSQGAPFRSDFFLKVAVLRVAMPSPTMHNMVTSTFRVLFDMKLLTMGMPLLNYKWLLDRTQKTMGREKRPDDYFFPSKKVTDDDWPGLVLGIGKSQSTDSLEEAAQWWLRKGGLGACLLRVATGHQRWSEDNQHRKMGKCGTTKIEAPWIYHGSS